MMKPVLPPPPPSETARDERDWFFDELMTPQPDATQEFLRRRLKELAQPTPAKDDSAPR